MALQGTMKAAVLRDRAFHVEQRPVPVPGPGEVLVRTRACGICGSDLHFFKHAHDILERAASLGAPTEDMRRGLAAGLVLGHEFVGEIVAFGPDTEQRLRVGDRVCSMPFLSRQTGTVLLGSTPEASGAYAQYLCLTEALLLKVDESLPDEAAALTEPLGIAIHAVNAARPGPDDTAFVVGCGPIGLAIIAALRLRGIGRIIASDLSPGRRRLARDLGADEVVDGRTASPFAVAGVAAGGGAVVFENTGAAGVLGRVVLEAPARARIVVTGIAAGEESFLPMVAITKELSLSFVIYYTPSEFAEALDALAGGRVNWRPLITGKVGLAGVAGAFRDLEDPERHAKILIDPWA
ncbi:MAG: alcohol dehydrogenase catalytic domain-containing protein [Alphaproteobacteria bacterium]|nr:alcohol dehydrogenase catalytic domain-containing protein [Alphaproteobacteria bacterium]